MLRTGQGTECWRDPWRVLAPCRRHERIPNPAGFSRGMPQLSLLWRLGLAPRPGIEFAYPWERESPGGSVGRAPKPRGSDCLSGYSIRAGATAPGAQEADVHGGDRFSP